jgi:hypothetical protein
MENTEQESRLKIGLCKLKAYSQLIEEYAYKNRAKMVQRLIEQKQQVEEKLGVILPRNSPNLSQNPATCGLSLGADSHITSDNKGGLNKNRGSLIFRVPY